jgi:hypothetical protein
MESMKKKYTLDKPKRMLLVYGESLTKVLSVVRSRDNFSPNQSEEVCTQRLLVLMLDVLMQQYDNEEEIIAEYNRNVGLLIRKVEEDGLKGFNRIMCDWINESVKLIPNKEEFRNGRFKEGSVHYELYGENLYKWGDTTHIAMIADYIMPEWWLKRMNPDYKE